MRNRSKILFGTLILCGLVVFSLWYLLSLRLTVPVKDAFKNGEKLLTYHRVLAFAAHPDDIEWYISGTLRRFVLKGSEVHVVIASSGERGPNRIQVNDLANVREKEQQAAGEVIGYTRVYFLRLPDRGVAHDSRLKPMLIQLIKTIQPDVILTFDPELPALPYFHPDHQGGADVLFELYRELDLPRPALYFWQTRRPNTIIDTTHTIEDKLNALAMHVTQGAQNYKQRA
jgi:LmbE family N-acetylglucosaminyl deacetylase